MFLHICRIPHLLNVVQAHLKRGGALASGHVPHAHSLVPTAAEQLAAVRAVRHTSDMNRVSLRPRSNNTPPLSLTLTSLTQPYASYMHAGAAGSSLLITDDFKTQLMCRIGRNKKVKTI